MPELDSLPWGGAKTVQHLGWHKGGGKGFCAGLTSRHTGKRMQHCLFILSSNIYWKLLCWDLLKFDIEGNIEGNKTDRTPPS